MTMILKVKNVNVNYLSWCNKFEIKGGNEKFRKLVFWYQVRSSVGMLYVPTRLEFKEEKTSTFNSQ